MKILLLAIAFSFSISLCKAQTQYQLDSAEGAKYSNADSELNTIYKKILKDYADDTTFIKNLQLSERIWIKFRDAELKMKYPERPEGYYGSVQPMCVAIYLTQLTEDRINTLKVWIDGIEEGDVCAGSVKRKN